MHYQREIKVLMNDLNSLFVRIEDLPAHSLLTTAGQKVQEARNNLAAAAGLLQHADMGKRYDV